MQIHSLVDVFISVFFQILLLISEILLDVRRVWGRRWSKEDKGPLNRFLGGFALYGPTLTILIHVFNELGSNSRLLDRVVVVEEATDEFRRVFREQDFDEKPLYSSSCRVSSPLDLAFSSQPGSVRDLASMMLTPF